MDDIVFAAGYYDAFTGSQQSMYPLLVETTAFDSTLLLPEWGECAEVFDAAGVTVDVLRYPERLDKFGGQLLAGGVGEKGVTGIWLLSYYLDVVRYFRSNSFDALYCNDVRSLLLFAPPAKVLGIPIIWYVRIDTPIDRIDHVGVRLADHILTISDGVRERFTDEELSTYGSKFTTLYTGVDLERFTPIEEDEQHKTETNESVTFVEVASIQSRKGQRELVEALEPVLRANEHARLVFAGDHAEGEAAYRRDVKRHVSEAGIDDSVEFLGWVDDVPSVLREADVFVLPSENEGFPRSILEAFAAGLPVVATDAGGTDELVTDGTNGFVVPVGDTEALRARLMKLAEDAALRDEMGAAGRRTVEREFSMMRYTEMFEQFVCRHVFNNERKA
ncbi:glycosyltransferase [Halomarina oriensis]|uniref:Glycosyltransferase n=1 Tax=Halomarina oriensis TaxID=671145 RepID=A0A6B0GHU4_9EURY|nr:glycosyltransferase [Halomarina oriensis]MWG34432.1 glycosyltransferase [Halomarina oriensis]